MDKLLRIVRDMQKKGIPVFLFRDEKTKGPSVSLSLLLISFAISALGLLGKYAKLVDGIDVNNSFELLIITSSLYFGRKWSKKFAPGKDDESNEEK